jgi:class 3 adenylate cyclase
MKIKYAATVNCRKCLQISLPVEVMVRIAQLVDPNYDIYRRTGLKEGMPIPNQNAAERIVADMVQNEQYVDFMETLVLIDREGYMGHHYELKGFNNAVNSLVNEGYIFDKVSGRFFENQKEQLRLNWGRLKDGDEQKMAMLRLDIVGNSVLVKNNPRPKIEKAYNDIRDIVDRAVTSRLGRLWSWEGDGALAAFLIGPIEKVVVYAGMDILHELFFYNRLRNPLNSPINLRLGAHIGQIWYSNNELERLNNETIKQAMVYEALATKNALCVSYNLCITMDQIIFDLFSAEKTGRSCKYRLYALGLEK